MHATELYRNLLKSAHEFLEGTMADVTPAEFTWDPPGKAFSIAGNYAHVVFTEDMAIQSLLKGTDMLATTVWAGRFGASEMPALGPGGDLKGWSHRATVDLATMRAYALAVYAETDAYVDAMTAEDFARPLDLARYGFGQQTALFILTAILVNASMHTGEVSCLKGLQGMKGYPA